MVIEHTVDTFEKNPHIEESAIVSNPFYVSDIENIVLRNGWKKVKKILKGGKERYDSSLSATRVTQDATSTSCSTTLYARWCRNASSMMSAKLSRRMKPST